jgi:hypothetical protein
MTGWITNDPEVAEQLRRSDAWAQQQRLEANRMAFNADRLKRAAIALRAKAASDQASDYAEILSQNQLDS